MKITLLHNVEHGDNLLLHLFEKQGVLERNLAFFVYHWDICIPLVVINLASP